MNEKISLSHGHIKKVDTRQIYKYQVCGADHIKYTDDLCVQRLLEGSERVHRHVSHHLLLLRRARLPPFRLTGNKVYQESNNLKTPNSDSS